MTTMMSGTQDEVRAGAEQASAEPPVKASGRVTPKGRRASRYVLAGGLGALVVLLAAGAMFRHDADFASDYVARQLGEQRIKFTPAAELTSEDQELPCLVRYAGQSLTTGKQAECYANDFIGRHLKSVAGGKTYSEMRAVQNDLRAKIAAAQAANDPAVPDLNKQLAEATAKRQTLLEGESMRGLLLTSYGFSTLGAKAGQAADAARVGGGAALLIAVGAALWIRRRCVRIKA